MSSTLETILVTGGAGYIGSHAVKQLQRGGYRVIILDNLVYGHRDLVENVLKAELIVGDIQDRKLLDELFARNDIDAVIHFAAYAYVGESVTEPAKYYRNNVVGTLTLLEAMNAAGVDKFVFSSTCATYGIPSQIPMDEDHPQIPINPYGASKFMVERIIKDFGVAYGLRYTIFRYFNAAGADPEGDLGEDHNPETHLIPLIVQAALGLRPHVSIFGTDHPTRDGTCIRDYIHVTDLADAHVLGLQYLSAGGVSDVFNLSNGNGFSVQEIIEAACLVTGKAIATAQVERRPGDPPVLIGQASKACERLGWKPQYEDIHTILSHAWHWHKRRYRKQWAT
jgi:UDP-glucose 4-epimerase